MPLPQRPRVQRGLNCRVLTIFALCFCSILFMLGRPTYLKIYDEYVKHGPGNTLHGNTPKVDPAGSTPGQIFAPGEPSVAGSTPGQTSAAGEPTVQQSPSPPSPSPPVVASTPPPVPSPSSQPPLPPPLPAPSTQQEAFDPKKLTKERVLSLAQDGYLMVTWSNYHYLDFTLSWVKHVRDVGVTGYIVGAMDDQILQALLERKLNTFSMESGLTLGDFGWGSKTFAKMGRQKISLIAMFLRLGVHVIIADVDTVWLRDPIPFFKRFPEADILTSSDHLSNTVDDESLEIWPQAASAANIGIMLFREKSLAFVDEWIKIIESDDNIWDQNAFNDLFRRGAHTISDDTNHLFMGDNNKLKMGILPVSIFASGHTYFVQRQAERLGLKPYVVHATFQFSGTPGKRHRMREMLIWDDPPSYFDSEQGFLRFDLDLPEALLKGSGPLTGQMDLANVQGHFKLVNHQMLQIRHALGFATALGRTIIVPEIWCGMDRWWAPHAGLIPGSRFPLPFRCPLDHVFNLEDGWAKRLPEEQFGPHIDFREYSFLNNSRLTAAVNASRIVVEICPAGTADCSDGSMPALINDGRVKIQAGLKAEAIRKALASVQGFKILSFTSMLGNTFGGFESEQATNRFFNRMQHYASIWCCIHAHPGHIHYDMWWDVPHADKFGRNWDVWEPKTGP